MYLIRLRFADRSEAPPLLDAHKQWIDRGFADGVFLLVGNLEPAAGGAILAHGESRDAVAARVSADPFVAQGVVEAEISEITPTRTTPDLAFLKG